MAKGVEGAVTVYVTVIAEGVAGLVDTLETWTCCGRTLWPIDSATVCSIVKSLFDSFWYWATVMPSKV